MPQPVMVQPAPMPPQPHLHQPSLPDTAPGVGQGGAGWRGLFRNATGLMRRNVESEAPVAAPRAEPSLGVQPARQPRPAQPQPDEMGLDIPTFLRRQSN
jgi:hypothetical protein